MAPPSTGVPFIAIWQRKCWARNSESWTLCWKSGGFGDLFDRFVFLVVCILGFRFKNAPQNALPACRHRAALSVSRPTMVNRAKRNKMPKRWPSLQAAARCRKSGKRKRDDHHAIGDDDGAPDGGIAREVFEKLEEKEKIPLGPGRIAGGFAIGRSVEFGALSLLAPAGEFVVKSWFRAVLGRRHVNLVREASYSTRPSMTPKITMHASMVIERPGRGQNDSVPGLCSFSGFVTRPSIVLL